MLSDEELEQERVLVEAAQQDRTCFAPLYERYFDRVYAFALRRSGRDRAAAEEITSETFALALANLPRFEWRNKPLWPWLCAIALHLSINMQQRAARHVPLDDFNDERLLACSDQEFREAEAMARLYALVARLTDLQRKAMVMRFAEDLSIKQVAAILGCSEGAVKQLQLRAVRRLKEWLGESDA